MPTLTAQDGRGIPLTHNRALTELAKCRRDLSSASESLALVVAIFGHLDVAVSGPEPEDILGRIEEAEALLRRVVP